MWAVACRGGGEAGGGPGHPPNINKEVDIWLKQKLCCKTTMGGGGGSWHPIERIRSLVERILSLVERIRVVIYKPSVALL